MKVSELVAKLLELEQDKDIWICYDRCASIEPEVVQAGEDDEIDKIKTGDYLINAW